MRVAIIERVSPGNVRSLQSELASTPGWDLRIFYALDSQRKPVGDVPFTYKKSFSISYERKSVHRDRVKFADRTRVVLPLGLVFDLWRYRPDVIISVEMGFSSFVAAIYALLAEKPLVLHHYGTLHSERNINWTKRTLRKFLCRRANTYIGMGNEVREYLRSLGISDEAIFDARNAIDMLPFLSDISTHRRTAVRNELGIVGLCFLYVGQMIPRKGIDSLLDAWDLFSKQIGKEAFLLMVGAGNQREAILRRVKRMEVKNVRCLPFVQPPNLPEIYHAADIFAFPTLEDRWARVVNEAMASGLPVICSKYAGCASELIVEGKNGWIIDPLDRSEVVATLLAAWDARQQIQAMGAESQKMILPINITNMAEGFRRAVRYALSK